MAVLLTVYLSPYLSVFDFAPDFNKKMVMFL